MGLLDLVKVKEPTTKKKLTPEDFRQQLYVVVVDSKELTDRVALAPGQKSVILPVRHPGRCDRALLYDRETGGDPLKTYRIEPKDLLVHPKVNPSVTLVWRIGDA